MSIASFFKDILTVATAVKVAAGAVLHKVYQWFSAKLKAVEADASKIIADVKKDV